MRKKAHILALLLALAFLPAAARATTLFTANLTGLGENPPNASPATGFGTVVLNDPMDQITVDLSWTGLTAPATASHIHGPAGPGTNAPVMFPFTGVPSATSGTIPEQTFAISPTQVGYLMSGLLYMNVHTANFPGGEIRGQLQAVTPEPSALALVAFGLAAMSGLTVLARRA